MSLINPPLVVPTSALSELMAAGQLLLEYGEDVEELRPGHWLVDLALDQESDLANSSDAAKARWAARQRDTMRSWFKERHDPRYRIDTDAHGVDRAADDGKIFAREALNAYTSRATALGVPLRPPRGSLVDFEEPASKQHEARDEMSETVMPVQLKPSPDPLEFLPAITDGSAASRNFAPLLSTLAVLDAGLEPLPKRDREMSLSHYTMAKILRVDEATCARAMKWGVAHGYIKWRVANTPCQETVKISKWKLTRKARKVLRGLTWVNLRERDDLDMWGALGSIKTFIVDSIHKGTYDTIATLAKALRMGLAAVRTHIKELHDAGILASLPRSRPRTSNGTRYGWWQYTQRLVLAEFGRMHRAQELGTSGLGWVRHDAREAKRAAYRSWVPVLRRKQAVFFAQNHIEETAAVLEQPATKGRVEALHGDDHSSELPSPEPPSSPLPDGMIKIFAGRRA